MQYLRFTRLPNSIESIFAHEEILSCVQGIYATATAGLEQRQPAYVKVAGLPVAGINSLCIRLPKIIPIFFSRDSVFFSRYAI